MLSNVNIQSFLQAARDDNSDMRIIKVMDHKTVAHHGPANLIISDNLHSWIKAFIENLRSRIIIQKEAEEYVFVSWEGRQMASSQISEAVNTIFQKTGRKHRVSATRFRQTASTEVRNKRPALKGPLADLMCHKEATGDRDYFLKHKEDRAVEAAKVLPSLMRGKTQSVSKSFSGFTQTKALKSVSSSTCTKASLSASSSTCTKPSESLNSHTHTKDKSYPSRKIWTAEEEDFLIETFEFEMSSKSITKCSVEEKMKDNDRLKKYSCKTIENKVRHLCNSKRFKEYNESQAKKVKDLPSESSSERIQRLFKGHSSGRPEDVSTVTTPDLDNDMIQPDDVSDDVPDDNGLDPDYSPPNDHDNDMIQLDDVSDDVPDDSDVDPDNSPLNNEIEVDPDEVIAPTVSTTASYVHQIFSDTQIGTVLKQCNVIIKSGPISDARIKCALKQSKEGKELLENFTLTQIKNRVKYERRKLKR